MKKRDQEPLKLMPLDEFGKLLGKVASARKTEPTGTETAPTNRSSKRRKNAS